MTDWSKFTPDATASKPVDWSKFESDTPPENTPLKRTLVGTVKDVAVTAGKGLIGLAESGVGIADLVSGGAAGKALENNGYNLKADQEFLSNQYSDAQKAANAKVENAQGFMDTAKAAIQNPSTIATAIGESLPSMIAGGLVGRGVGAAAKLGKEAAPYLAGLGEGVVSAGQGAEQIRQQTDDGLLTGKQAAIAAGSGALTGLVGTGSNKLASKLGITDADTLLAGGTQGATNKGLVRRIGEGALTEGALEELPQSTQEQMAQNVALGKDPMQGVGNAAAMGLLTGGVMGGGMGVLHNPQQAPMQSPPVEPAAQMPPVEPIAPTPQTPYPNNIQQDGVTRPVRPDFTMDLAGKEVAPYQQPLAPAIKPNSPLNNALASAGISTAPPLAQSPVPAENQFVDNGNRVQPLRLNSPLQKAASTIQTPDVMPIPAQDGQIAPTIGNNAPRDKVYDPEKVQREAAEKAKLAEIFNSKKPPAPLDDERVAEYGDTMRNMAKDLQVGGGVTILPDGSRTPSTNMQLEWFNGLRAAIPNANLTPKGVENAVNKAIEGKKLHRNQEAIVVALLDHIDEQQGISRTAQQAEDAFSPPDMTPDVRTPDDDLRDALTRVKPHINEDDFYELATDESLPIEKRTQFLNSLADNYEKENDTRNEAQKPYTEPSRAERTEPAQLSQSQKDIASEATRGNDVNVQPAHEPVANAYNNSVEVNSDNQQVLNEKDKTEPTLFDNTLDNGNNAKSSVSRAAEEQRPPLQQSQIDKLDHVAQFQPDEVKNAIELFKSNPNNKTVENNLRDVADSIYDNYPAAADLIHEALDERNTSISAADTREKSDNSDTSKKVESVTDKKFNPTHELPDGTKVKLETDEDGNKYFVEHDGSEWDYTDSAEAITNEKNNAPVDMEGGAKRVLGRNETSETASATITPVDSKVASDNQAATGVENAVEPQTPETLPENSQPAEQNATPTPQPILNTNGKPVTSFVGARGALKKQGLFDSHEAVKQDDGSFVAVPKAKTNVQAAKNENLLPPQKTLTLDDLVAQQRAAAQKNENFVPVQNTENSVAIDETTAQKIKRVGGQDGWRGHRVKSRLYAKEIMDAVGRETSIAKEIKDAWHDHDQLVKTIDSLVSRADEQSAKNAQSNLSNNSSSSENPNNSQTNNFEGIGSNAYYEKLKTMSEKEIENDLAHKKLNPPKSIEHDEIRIYAEKELKKRKNAHSNNSEIPNSSQADFEQKAHEAATSPYNDLSEPTPAQKESGNYKKGHAKFQSLDITIENPKGSKRSGTDKDGKAWSVDMAHHYGYVKGSVGADNEQVDVFVGDNHESTKAFVVNQIHPHNGKFDEHKVMLGFDTEAEAREGYLKNYAKGWKGLDSITEIPVSELKAKIESGAIKKPIKPVEKSPENKQVTTDVSKNTGKIDTLPQPKLSSDELAGYLASAVRSNNGIGFSQNKDKTFNLKIDGTHIATIDYEPRSAEQVTEKILKNYKSALDSEGKTLPSNPEDMTRDQFLIANKFGNLIQDFEISGADIQNATGGLKHNTDGTFGIDHDALYDRIQAQKAQRNTLKIEQKKPADYGSKNKYVTQSRADELRAKLKAKLGQLNSGIDPELVAMGTELAVFHIEAGVRKFTDLAQQLASDLDTSLDKLKPFLRSWYNGARDMLEDFGENVDDMDSPEIVKAELKKLFEAKSQRNSEEKNSASFPAPTQADIPSQKLVAALAMELGNKNGAIDKKTLHDLAKEAFGGTQAQGAYSTNDATDALEAAFNLYLQQLDRKAGKSWTEFNAGEARAQIVQLTARIQKLPTQTVRDAEKDNLQQFSTPPALSFLANWVANVTDKDTMLEPSAGTGDLAIWSKMAGAKILLNEISPRRLEILRALFPKAQIFKENGEQLNNVLPADAVPTVIVMNPPFSSSATVSKNNTMNGAKHIEQALARLQDGGRLVAIVGNGMGADKAAFKKWWDSTKLKYNVRANIGISGKEYAKYGTTFDNQILVIDKTGATTQPILTGKVESVAELPDLLESIRNDRQAIVPSEAKADEKAKSAPAQQTSGANSQSQQSAVQPSNGTSGNQDGDSRTGREYDNDRLGRPSDNNRMVKSADERPTVSNEKNGGEQQGESTVGEYDTTITDRKRSSGDIAGNIKQPANGKQSDGSNKIGISATENKSNDDFTDSIFSNYTPQKLHIAGAKPHPAQLVQSAAMAAVEPPTPTYSPTLPKEVITDGKLSIAQLEAVVYAGQAHAEILPNGERKGFFIGDNTGVGKGREISGIILDNMNQGKSKAVWVSFNEGLINDAKRDYEGVGGNSDKIFFQGKTKPKDTIQAKDGILFTSYTTVASGSKQQANDLGQEKGQSRLDQIINWLGADFDGVIAFDEAHKMGNAEPIKGKRGTSKPSQQAIAGINLQKALPKARIVYVSATGATELSNLAYATRLGLWGEGTPFANSKDFIQKVSQGGIAAMELVSRDMKALGMYISRSISYDGVSYERLDAQMTPLQIDIYNELAKAWQTVLQNVNAALEKTGGAQDSGAKSSAMSAFWGSQQRFFSQVITALQTPAVIDDIQKRLDNGEAVLVQIVNTNEATQERMVAQAKADGTDLEDLDFTPREMLMSYIRNSFPVAAYEDYEDDEGNTKKRPVTDSNGNPVFDKEAIAMRDNLLNTLQQIRVPENPIDSIINAFGADAVAEVTGRGRRFVQTRNDDGEIKVIEQKRSKTSSQADAKAYQDDKKKILIFSGAGGTGYSFHADNTAANKRKRIHYIMQAGWKADAAVQGFGRSHRSNQAQPPHYVLPMTHLKAQKRFVSSIARRLDQLGAMTKGQRQTTSQGMFTAADNLESDYALEALHVLFKDMYLGRTQLNFHETATELGLNLFDSDGNFSESKIPTIPQFLNRLLSLTDARQDQVFEEFEERINDAVEYAKQRGTYDEGVQTLKANSIKKTRDDVAHTDEKTGATTRYVELSVENDVHYADWKQVEQTIDMLKKSNKYGGFYQLTRGVRAGQIVLLSDNGTRLNAEGHEVHRGALYGIKQGSPSYIDNVNELKQGYTWATIDKKYQKVEISKPIDEADAKAMWNEQIAAAPKTETKTERMIVGVILPIWDRLKGSEKIMRMQTDDGEQLLGRMVSAKDSAAILKNLGLDSSASKLTPDETIKQIKDGAKAVLANGWEIFTSTVNGEKRIEIKPTKTSGFSVPEQGILKSQGVFMERIAWVDRFFIPTNNNDVFKRITDSKPVVDLLGGKSESQFSKTQSTANAYTKESLNGALQNAANSEFGKGWFARLWQTGKFKIIDSNEAKALTNDAGVQAFYHNGTTYFVADGIASKTDLVGLLKHEIGVHALKMGKDDAGFKSILKQLESMRGKNAAVDDAFNAAERAGTSAANMAEEALGYFVEKNPKHKLTDRIIAWFKKAIAKLTGNYQFDPADLHKMAREALRKAPDELGLDAVEPQGLKLSASAMKSVDANIKRGNESMNKALLEKTTVHRAMFRAGMGWVDFVWGREGLPPDSKGRRKGAMGISHILEARQRKDSLSKNQSEEILFNLVEAIAKGTEVQRFESENSTTVKLDYKNHQVMLAKSKGSNSWIVTGFELYESGKGGSGYDAPPSTHSKSTLTRNGAGADAENIPQSSNDSIKFSKTQPSSDFELPEETMPQKQQRLWQDMNNRWKTAVDEIKAKGGKINESNNVYDAMERMPHIAAERITDFKRDTLNPLIERVARAKTNFDDIATLLYATHAPERNAEMQKINPRFKNGNGSGMTDADAKLEIQKLKAKYGADFATVEAIAKDFQAVTQSTAQMLEQSGAISQEEAARYKDTYKNYVPLKGFEVLDEKGNRGNGNGLGHSTAKKFGKRALGRESRAGQIIENIVRDHERAIVWQGKAEVGRAVEQLIKDNKGTIGTIDVLPRQSIVKNDKVTSMIAPFDPENEIRFLRNGREVRIQLNDDLLLQSYNRLGESNLNGIFAASASLNRFLRQAWTQKNPAFFLINPIRDIQTAAVVLTGEGGVKLAAKAMKNWRSSWATMLAHATEKEKVKLSVTEQDILKRYRESGGSVGTAYISSLERAGDQLHHELARHGGESFQSLIKAGKYKEAMQTAAFRTLNNRLFDFIEHLNTAFEGATRLATFKAAIDSGYSDMQAASLSSNVTVNFTKRGEYGQQLGAMYLFANANIQGTANIFKTLTESNYKGQAWGIVGGIVALSFMATMMGGDDGEDDLVSDYEKERNISIDIGDGKRVTIPVAYGWSFFKDLGRAMAQMANGGDAEKISKKLVSSFMGNFSPIGNPIPAGEFSGNNALVAFAPTATKPFVMPTVNKGAFGTPLMPESPFKPNQPDSEKIYRKTRGTGYEDVAKGLNSLTGGDSATSGWIDISPETIKNTINYIAGGAGRFITDSAALTSTPLNDEAYKLENTPIVKSFYKSESIDDYRRRFYAQADDVTKVVEQLQTYKKERNATEFKELYAEKGKLIALNKQVTATKKMLQNLRDREDMARANGTSTASIEAQERQLLARFNAMYAR